MKIRLKLLLLMMLLPGGQLLAQGGIRVESGLLSNTGLDVFFLKDFDINRPGTGPPIFFVNIENLGGARTVFMELMVSSRRRGNLSRGRTGEFTLAPGQLVNLTSNDIFSNRGIYRLRDYQIDDAAVKGLLADILARGKLPSDIYTFNVVVFDVAGGQQDSDVFDLRVSNPRKLDLIFPGAPATGKLGDCPVVFSGLPQFRWESDMRLFRVIVAPLRRGEDPESALNNEPRFTRVFVLQGKQKSGLLGGLPFSDRVETIPNTSFQFPPSGEVLTFRPGRTYVWRVIGIINTSSGPIQAESEIYCFRIANVDNMNSGMEQLSVLLRNLLGADFEKLFGEGGELEGFRPKRLRFEGKDVTASDLLVRMRKLRDSYRGYKVE